MHGNQRVGFLYVDGLPRDVDKAWTEAEDSSDLIIWVKTTNSTPST